MKLPAVGMRVSRTKMMRYLCMRSWKWLNIIRKRDDDDIKKIMVLLLLIKLCKLLVADDIIL